MRPGPPPCSEGFGSGADERAVVGGADGRLRWLESGQGVRTAPPYGGGGIGGPDAS